MNQNKQAWTGLSKHKKRQLGLLLIVVIIAVIGILSVIIRPSDPYYRVALAIEKQFKWVDVLNVYHESYEGNYYLDVIVVTPMYQAGDKLLELHEFIYKEMLKATDGKEDFLSTFFVFGGPHDFSYRVVVSAYLDKEYIGGSFDIAEWVAIPRDYPLTDGYVKWEGR